MTITKLLLLCLSLPAPAETATNDEGLKAFRSWAERMTFTTLRADFISTQLEKRSEGTWHVRLEPGFAQKLEYRVFAGAQGLYEKRLSWDLLKGEARSYTRRVETLRGQGVRAPKPSNLFGFANMPSNSFFFVRRNRSLARHLKTVDIEVRRLGGEGARIAVYLTDKDLSPRLSVYILNTAAPQPLEELRSYTLRPPPVEKLATDLGDPIPLPDQFKKAIFFVNKVVTESAEIAGKPFPVKWDVRHCFHTEGQTITISLKEDSVALNAEYPDSHFLLTWPVGTRVFDSSKGEGYSIGDGGQHITMEMIRESDLDRILKEAGLEGSGDAGGTKKKLVGMETGCGANALYIAYAMLGKHESLGKISDALGLGPDHPSCSMADLVDLSELRGIEALPLECDERALRVGPGTPVILHVHHKEKRDHFMVVDDYQAADDSIRILDPPLRPYRAKAKDVNAIWTHKALFLGPASQAILSHSTWWNSGRGRAYLAAAAVFLSVGLICALRRKKP